jgi:hypothetical protein
LSLSSALRRHRSENIRAMTKAAAAAMLPIIVV